jgi:hypothetical protein
MLWKDAVLQPMGKACGHARQMVQNLPSGNFSAPRPLLQPKKKRKDVVLHFHI